VLTFFLRTVFFTFLPLSVFANTLHESPMPEEVLDYLVYSDHNAPYQFMDVETGHKGIVCSIVDRVAQEAGLTVHAHMEPIKRLKRSIESGRYRQWITYGMKSWENDPAWSQHHFSEVSIFQFNPAIVLPSSSVLKLESLADIGARKVLTIHGFDYGRVQDFLVKRGAEIEAVDTQQKALSMLRQGRADVFLEDVLRVRYALASMDWSADYFKMVPLRPLDDSGAFSVTLVMSSDMPSSIVESVNGTLNEMSASGQLREIVERYSQPRDDRLSD